jgi:hypothetical protein
MTAPYTPQHNGLAERKNRTLVDMVNAMLLNAKLPNNLWGEALLTACHIHNRVLSKKLNVSPYEAWNGRKPNLNYFKVWGCHDPNPGSVTGNAGAVSKGHLTYAKTQNGHIKRISYSKIHSIS